MYTFISRKYCYVKLDKVSSNFAHKSTCKLSTNRFCFRYSVMAGTPEKMLEHLLEGRLGKGENNGKITMYPCVAASRSARLSFYA